MPVINHVTNFSVSFPNVGFTDININRKKDKIKGRPTIKNEGQTFMLLPHISQKYSFGLIPQTYGKNNEMRNRDKRTISTILIIRG